MDKEKEKFQVKLFGPDEIDHIAWLIRNEEMERVVTKLTEIRNTIGLGKSNG